MESEPVSLILTPTTDTPVAAVMAQVQAASDRRVHDRPKPSS